MNIKDDLTCNYCNQIFNNPVLLTCCSENICKQHLEELMSNNSSNKFNCPLCNNENSNQNLNVNKFVEKMVRNELHKFHIDSDSKLLLNNFRKEIANLEKIIKDPDNVIYEEISELKRQVDLDREKGKAELDELADDLIQQLESYESKFKSEYKANVDFKYYNDFIESSRQQSTQYEQFLNLFSTSKQERHEKGKEQERLMNLLQSKVKEVRNKLFLNSGLSYKPMEDSIKDSFGRLTIKAIKNKNEFQGKIKKVIKAHDGSIYGLTVLPSGHLVSGSQDRTIKIWNVNDGTLMKTLTGHRNCIWDLVVLDGNRLISASRDCTINIWNIDEGTVERTLTGHTKGVLALKMLKNGDLVSGSDDSTIKIWDTNNVMLKKTLTGHTNSVWALLVLKNGDLVSGSSDTTIKIWDVDTGMVKRTLTGHRKHVDKLALLNNGYLVSGSADSTIKIWNIKDGTVRRTLTGHMLFVSALKLLDNGDLVSGSGDGSIKIWDVETGMVKKDLQVMWTVTSVEILKNGDLVSAFNNSIAIWE